MRPLAPEVAARLRAGPAAVDVVQCVEELVLNSIDAGAHRICVEVSRERENTNGTKKGRHSPCDTAARHACFLSYSRCVERRNGQERTDKKEREEKKKRDELGYHHLSNRIEHSCPQRAAVYSSVLITSVID